LFGKQGRRFIQAGKHTFSHAIVQSGQNFIEVKIPLHMVGDAAL
jgi:hypothetical protein